MALRTEDAVDFDLSRLIQRAFRETEEDGGSYDSATGAAVRAILAVYPEWSRDDAMDQIRRLGSGPY